MLIFSCQTKTNIGYGILPEDDIINAEITDTVTLNVYTLSMDTIVTSGVSGLLLGEYIDPVFGYSKASFVCQYGLAEYPVFSQESDHIADSAVLTLILDTVNLNYYGDIQAAHTIQIYRLTNNLDSDTIYYGNHDPSEFMTGDLIGETTITVNPDSAKIKIPLDQSLAVAFLDAENDVYTSSENFINFFKGVYIKSECENDDGAILKFKVNSESVLSIYFHESTTPEEALEFKVTSNTSSAVRFNMFEHDYTGVSFENNIDNEEGMQDSVAYIQAMGGLRTKINMPYIENLKDLGDIVIYRAELIIKTAPTNDTYESSYSAIEKLLLTGYSPEYEYYLLAEYISGSSYLGEDYSDSEYRFDIASYIRNILDGTTENNGFYLFSSSGNKYFNRSVITTGKHSQKMKLYITYAKFLAQLIHNHKS